MCQKYAKMVTLARWGSPYTTVTRTLKIIWRRDKFFQMQILHIIFNDRTVKNYTTYKAPNNRFNRSRIAIDVKASKKVLKIIPLSNQTQFQRVQSGAPVDVLRSESNFFYIPRESQIKPDELLSKMYPPRTLLANQKFIRFQRWFSENKSGLKGFPLNTD